MRVILGSRSRQDYRHHAGDSPDLTLNQVIGDEQVDDYAIRYIELEPGQASLHDVGHDTAAWPAGG